MGRDGAAASELQACVGPSETSDDHAPWTSTLTHDCGRGAAAARAAAALQVHVDVCVCVCVCLWARVCGLVHVRACMCVCCVKYVFGWVGTLTHDCGVGGSGRCPRSSGYTGACGCVCVCVCVRRGGGGECVVIKRT